MERIPFDVAAVSGYTQAVAGICREFVIGGVGVLSLILWWLSNTSSHGITIRERTIETFWILTKRQQCCAKLVAIVVPVLRGNVCVLQVKISVCNIDDKPGVCPFFFDLSTLVAGEK
jgi:hypothetical protein